MINTGIYLINQQPYLTKNFSPVLYLGNPRNILEIFSSLKYHELSVSSSDMEINSESLNFLRWLASGSKRPLMYSGQIKSVDDSIKIIECGFEKISLQSLYLNSSITVSCISKLIGKQSLTLNIDCFYDEKRNIWLMKNGYMLNKFLSENFFFIENFFGELNINSITHNGCFNFNNIDINSLINLRNIMSNINIGFCGGICDKADLELIKNIGFDSCSIYSSSTLSPERTCKLPNANLF